MWQFKVTWKDKGMKPNKNLLLSYGRKGENRGIWYLSPSTYGCKMVRRTDFPKRTHMLRSHCSEYICSTKYLKRQNLQEFNVYKHAFKICLKDLFIVIILFTLQFLTRPFLRYFYCLQSEKSIPINQTLKVNFWKKKNLMTVGFSE